MNRLENFLGFLTPARRQAIYSVVAVLAAALVVFGLVTQDQLDSVVQNISGIIGTLTALMAALNTNK